MDISTRQIGASAVSLGAAVVVTLGLVTAPPVSRGLAEVHRVEFAAVQLQSRTTDTDTNTATGVPFLPFGGNPWSTFDPVGLGTYNPSFLWPILAIGAIFLLPIWLPVVAIETVISFVAGLFPSAPATADPAAVTPRSAESLAVAPAAISAAAPQSAESGQPAASSAQPAARLNPRKGAVSRNVRTVPAPAEGTSASGGADSSPASDVVAGTSRSKASSATATRAEAKPTASRTARTR